MEHRPSTRRRGGVRAAWLTAATFAASGSLLFPAVAFAAGGGDGDSDSTLVVLALILVVAGAYLLTHFVVERLQRVFLVVTGIEYILLGFLLGPQVPIHIPAFSELDNLLPVVALAVGWVGLLRGMELSFRRGASRGLEGAARFVLVQALVAGGVTSVAAYFAFASGAFFQLGEPTAEASHLVSRREIWMAIGVMGCAAAAGSVSPVELLEQRYSLQGGMAERIRRMAALSDLLAIGVFGLLACIFHPVATRAAVNPTPTEWAVVSVLLGGLLGVLFTPFLGEDDSENGRFLAMVGIIVLASGAAYFLDLSPLLVNLCLGVVLVNTAKTGARIRATLERTKRPMALVLLVFAGALWRPVDPINAALVSAGYIALRLAGKAVGTYFASWRSPLRGDTYRGLIAHGEVSVAMAVSLRLVFRGEAVDLAYTAVLASVVINDLIAPRVLRGLFVDSGDIRGDRKEKAA
jgi:Kef-type K+ transport system membrane component KefB